MMRGWNSCRCSVNVLIATLGVCLLVGCSEGEPASLSGTVTFAGDPIEDGSIRFVPVEGAIGPGGSAKIVNGSYEITADSELLAGKHAVTFSATRAATAAEIAQQEREDAADADEEEEDDEDEAATATDQGPLRVSFLPEKYLRPSDIFVELAPGENTKDFDLEP